ncbi:MAG: glycerol-3-phosphate dehydrogenase/oxidase [Planctomycetes bacterium]|nr:glycerol-3-phosphate dehydrogenase/oxidase [Planctomycetota bacterium]
MPFSHVERAYALQSFREATFDVAIVGGGITGAGIARDAAMRGLSVALVEKGDIASGTSSRSSRLIHGGLRYLEQGRLGLVFEALEERTVLCRIAPHLARPLPFLFPVYEGSRRGLWTVSAGMWIYDGLSFFRSYRLHKTLSAVRVRELEPRLASDGLAGGVLYYDCATNDARLTLENAIAAGRAGASIATWCEATGFLREGGRVAGLAARDRLGGAEFEVRARVVVVAAGPWLDCQLPLATGSQSRFLRPTKGVHLVVPSSRLPVSHAVVGSAVADRRVIFLLPWGGFTIVGTTDTDYDGDPDRVAADAADVEYLLATANACIPGADLGPFDVASTYAGLRPLLRQEGVPESELSREHRILEPAEGLLAIAGGKLTTYRRMAAEVVDRALRELPPGTALHPACRSAEEPLPGAPGWTWENVDGSTEEKALLAEHKIPPDVVKHLLRTYGARAFEIASLAGKDPLLATRIHPDRPNLWAGLDFAVEEEMALRLEDFLVRRTSLFHKAPDQALGLARPVAERMARLLGWEEARVEEEVANYRELVAASRAFREGR